MLGSLTFHYEMHDGTERLDPRTWRAVVECALARSGEGLLICDGELAVLFCTPRAAQLLARVGMDAERVLPAVVVSVVNEQLAEGAAARTDRLPPLRGASAVYLQAATLRGAPPARVVVWLREEILRDDVLFALVKERYGVTPREFQLAQLVRKGLSNRAIAEQLRLAESTVKVYLHRLYVACGVSSRTGLAALLERLGA